MKIEFVIPGRIGGKGRPRFARVGKFVRTFTDAKTVNTEAMMRTIAAEAMKGLPLFTGPISLAVMITIQPPASWSGKKRTAAHFVTGKPDPDNTLKLFDSANGVIWRDDSQICDILFRRRYSIYEQESVRVWVADAGDHLEFPVMVKPIPLPASEPPPLFRHLGRRRVAA